jgi:hypothetical protein
MIPLVIQAKNLMPFFPILTKTSPKIKLIPPYVAAREFLSEDTDFR